MSAFRACADCLARTWLLERLSGHIDQTRAHLFDVLGLPARELLPAVAGRHRTVIARELELFDPGAAREACSASGIEQICRCDTAYPPTLSDLESPPAVVYVAGGMARFLSLAAERPVAIVGARKASSYGIEIARALAGGLAAAGVPVVSGMALGIDSAAHAAAVERDAPTVAVLPAGLDRPYPATKRMLAGRITSNGALVSELPPGCGVRRWMFPARNRIIAALCSMTIVVEAGDRSGSLVTASVAEALGRSVGAVPGRVNSRLAMGPNRLIASGARLIRSAEDVLDTVFGFDPRRVVHAPPRPDLQPELDAVLTAIADGADSPAALARTGLAMDRVLVLIGELELDGYIRREPGGRFTAVV